MYGRGKLVMWYVWITVLYGAEIWTPGKIETPGKFWKCGAGEELRR
jgi:hypothetical protein